MKEIHVPVYDNSPSVEQTLRPILYTSWFMGAGIARPQKCSKVVTIIIRIVHLAVCSVTMVCNVIYLLNFVTVTHFYSNMFSIIYFMNKVMCYVSAYYYIYHGIRQYNKWSKLMDKIKELDQKIRREMYISDQPVKKAEVVAILTTFACCPFVPIIHILFYFIYSQNNLASKLLFFYMLAQSLINSYVFDIVVYVLYYRFQAINKLIDQLDTSSTAPWIALKIKRIRELHTESDKTGITMCAIVLKCKPVNHDILHATGIQSGLEMQLEDLDSKQKFNWRHNLSNVIIENLLRRNLDRDYVRSEINDFSIQLQHRRVTFTACNFFEISNTVFCGFIGMIITYLIISIQFSE
ncbi:uncharacterized protein LOC105837909 isoform X2 [Monomorium pharaonis]|uniref:uncharacterized protein LOC105837909 isoform X2 n=1 Tax=Monomorium pharaonis TaxID=307658 RepID=UPI00063F77CF|nr:uncharacterized protein LOC105837909 isoform X2 [Monomorium pharaonis]